MASSNGSLASQNGPIPLWINGEQVTTKTTFEVISPNTGKKLWDSSSASVTEATNAVEAAHNAFASWSQTKPAYRRDILFKAAEILDKRRKDVAGFQDQETGSLSNFSHDFLATTTVEILRDVGGRIQDAIDGVTITTGQPGRNAMIIRQPYGVVLGIAPWNATSILGTRAFVYALAAGNTVVFKGSELSPRSFWILGDILHEAGLPAGVLNVIYHRPQDAAAVTSSLIEHPAVRKVNFTGSTNIGRVIAEQCAKQLKPCLLELGGKAPAIVCRDADVQLAAQQCTAGAFLHSGQICMSTERILVHTSIIESFTDALRQGISQLYPHHGEAPVLVSAAGVEKNHKLITQAQSAGAKLYRAADHPDSDAAQISPEELLEKDSKMRMRPIIVSGVKPEMDIYKTESFGPSVSIISFGGDDEEAAIKIANDTEYGLASAVFTKDLAKGFRIAKRIDSGAVHINSMSVHDEPVLPHGGVKASGWGRFNSRWGIEEFLWWKTITYGE